MLIECSKCESKVAAKEIGSNTEWDEETGEQWRVTLGECPACGASLLGIQDYYRTGYDTWEWGDGRRLWPEPENSVDWTIPKESRSSLEEARRCFRSKCYSACAVMCGKALEAIVVENTTEKDLYKGLRALNEKKIIDERLLEWGDSLRKERNLGAHASGIETTREDARDLLDFAIAICEYIYVLARKFENYKIRKADTN